ncbi:MAG: response regulator transcription factor [Alphaproteobacteria bacterium]|nr:response regulator transcription factor [Alphaproteobacteria bacterium]
MTSDLASVAKCGLVDPIQMPEQLIARGDPSLSPWSPGTLPQTAKSRDRHPSVPTIIIDSNALSRAGLLHIISDSSFTIVAECSDINELPEPSSGERRVLVFGLTDNSDTQLSQLAQWKTAHPRDLVLVLARQFQIDEAMASLKAGASCYLTNADVSRDMLLRSLELVSLGGIIISSRLTDALSAPVQQRECAPPLKQPRPSSVNGNMKFADPDIEGVGLSGRERLILEHLMRGASNKHIARDLGIAEATVKVHVKSLLRKTRVRNRTQAAMWGISHPAHQADAEQRV